MKEPSVEVVRVEAVVLTEQEAAEVLGVSKRQVGKWSTSGELPAFTYSGIKVKRYRLQDVREFAARKLQPA